MCICCFYQISINIPDTPFYILGIDSSEISLSIFCPVFVFSRVVSAS